MLGLEEELRAAERRNKVDRLVGSWQMNSGLQQGVHFLWISVFSLWTEGPWLFSVTFQEFPRIIENH